MRGSARFDAGFAAAAAPSARRVALRRRELQEDFAPLCVGVLGEAAEERAAVHLVGVHVAAVV